MSIIIWPYQTLPAAAHATMPRPFSRGGGRTLGGVERKTRTDRGFWRLTLDNIPIHTIEQRRTWKAIRTALGGEAGLLAIPVWSHDTAPYVSGQREPLVETTFDDGATFDDGSVFEQGAISVVAHAAASIGATSIQLRIINAAADLSGVQFSYNHALYETGPATDVSGDVWTVPIFPAIRAAIPAEADLNFDLPTCLVHMVDDGGMDIDFNVEGHTRRSVEFVEAVDYWNDLAVA